MAVRNRANFKANRKRMLGLETEKGVRFFDETQYKFHDPGARHAGQGFGGRATSAKGLLRGGWPAPVKKNRFKRTKRKPNRRRKRR